MLQITGLRLIDWIPLTASLLSFARRMYDVMCVAVFCCGFEGKEKKKTMGKNVLFLFLFLSLEMVLDTW